MAPNPFHALVLLILYFKRPRAFDPLALVVSSTAIDIEVVYAYIMGLPTPHLALHSFAVALTVYPAAAALFTYALERGMRGRLEKTYRWMRWDGRVAYPFPTIVACSLMGSLSHILIDVWSHPVSPYILWPFAYLPSNPFYIGWWSQAIDAAVILLGFYALYLWALRWRAVSEPS